MKKRTSFRKIIHVMHLWVGIPCALFLFIICLTGTIYVFNREITQWVDEDKFHVTLPANAFPLPMATLTSLLEKEQKGLTTTAVTIPSSKTQAWIFSMQEKEPGKKGGKGNMAKGPKAKPKISNFLVNPYTGRVQGDAQSTSFVFFNTVLQLHRWLLISNHDIGTAITGTAAILMIFLQISGIILWLPAKLRSWKSRRAWKQGFRIKFDATPKRLNFDLHKAVGFYTFLFITIMALTGPAMAFDWYKAGFSRALGVQPVKKGADNELTSRVASDTARSMTLETALARSEALFPYEGITRVTLPKNATGVFNIQKMQEGFFASAAIDRIFLDQYTGAIVKLDRFSDKTLGQKIVTLIKPIHTGELFGTLSKILYFIACLIATSLPVTGVIIWWGRRNKKGKTIAVVKNRQELQEEPA
ncbi:PepSY-associated TM helix domain-containing protein [Flavitalea sp. BT771]|uniref:PepSY-associated TM helix domain-containing protein n=1 Tax=Flavitalea sp. BT771 TaxID=3063329 RepID=UPI0026E33F1E|nr:PepSY-associated TM helix domain-containing protein [Flavitalea sp. BT771]MDO6435193.1 PepSY-associated TM helix domain-containing protein [Flavitalea sp. BT771]MDV6224102.1 PepSY-associated TM helix domain-containing protein [Flavitalea sp. BT771]